jgi:hypothetical protein
MALGMSGITQLQASARESRSHERRRIGAEHDRLCRVASHFRQRMDEINDR